VLQYQIINIQNVAWRLLCALEQICHSLNEMIEHQYGKCQIMYGLQAVLWKAQSGASR
jgi:hypothetical protein